jgi:hypothetical protein
MQRIEHQDFMAPIEKLRNHNAANETGATGHEYAHGSIQLHLSAFRVTVRP